MNKTNVRNIALSTPQWRASPVSVRARTMEYEHRMEEILMGGSGRNGIRIKQISDMEHYITFENLPLL